MIIALDWGDIVFLAGAGYMLGILAFTAFITISKYPEERIAYAFISVGALVCAGTSIYLSFHLDAPHWYLVFQLLGYACIGVGLLGLVTIRRRRKG